METKNIYIMGWEFYLGREEEAKRILSGERISKDHVEEYSFFQSCSRLQFVNETIHSVYEIEDGSEKTRNDYLDESEKKFMYFDSEPNKLQLLYLSQKTQFHKLGGKPVDGFTIPSCEKIESSFQYLGFISNADPFFSWLPFEKMQFCFPLHASVAAIYFDYSNPLEPKVLESKELEDVRIRDGIDRNTELIFEECFLMAHDFEENDGYMGQSGIPTWIQYPKFPVCPLSGKPMKFICQLESIPQIKLVKSSIDIPKDNLFLNNAVGCMDFWNDGYFYLFMNPETKTVCMFIQNS